MISKTIRRLLRPVLFREYFEPLTFRIGESAIAAQRAGRLSYEHLWDAELRVYSQWGEDGILNFLCDCLNINKPKALELGAGNFSECNTRFLAEYRHASVVAVDARDDLIPFVQGLPAFWRTSIWPLNEWITPDSTPEIQRTATELMGGVDIVSLDIDGNDYWVGQVFDLASVSILVVEYNPLFGAAMSVSVPRDDHFDRTQAHSSLLYFGASIRAWVDLFRPRGFTLVGTNRAGNNAFFCRTEQLNQIPLLPIDTSDLTPFVDWRVRESRDSHGNLSFLAGADRIQAIADLPLIDVTTGKMISVMDTIL